MGTKAGGLYDQRMVTSNSSGTVSLYIQWPGYIAFTGPGAGTLATILSSPEHEPQITVNETLTTDNKLVLNSYKAGRAVIRIEPSQYNVKKGTGTQ